MRKSPGNSAKETSEGGKLRTSGCRRGHELTMLCMDQGHCVEPLSIAALWALRLTQVPTAKNLCPGPGKKQRAFQFQC